eukprot:SAG31_NODE_2695_length_5236_cov_2.505651_2_plen_153_part_00
MIPAAEEEHSAQDAPSNSARYADCGREYPKPWCPQKRRTTPQKTLPLPFAEACSCSRARWGGSLSYNSVECSGLRELLGRKQFWNTSLACQRHLLQLRRSSWLHLRCCRRNHTSSLEICEQVTTLSFIIVLQKGSSPATSRRTYRTHGLTFG